MKVIIGFSTPKKFNLISRLIRLYEGTKFSHCYLVLPPNTETEFNRLYEASHGDVHCMKYSKWKEDNIILEKYVVDVGEETLQEIENYLWNQLQKPYSVYQILQLGINAKLKRNKNKAFICTELVGRILKKHLGYRLEIDLDFIGLKEIRNFINERFSPVL